MITVGEYKHKKIAVFGIGKAGEAAVAALHAGGAEVFIWDDHYDVTPPLPNPPPRGGREMRVLPVEQWPWQELSALVLSPGVPLTHPAPHEVVVLAKQHHCPIIGDVELLYRACPQASYIGITGTNGKSTTTTLIGHILKEAGIACEVGGNLGTAALSLNPLGKEGVYVLELSSYQLDLVHSTCFNIALLLNITPDHLDRHGTMEGYIAAKMHIFDRQTSDDVAVIAVDDAHTKKVASGQQSVGKVKLIEVSAQEALPEGVYVQDGVLYDGDYRFDIGNIVTLTGKHNWQNAAAAYAVCKAAGVAPEAIYKAMQSFAGLRHRLQWVADVKGVRFVNDSKATNADATSYALAAYRNIYWIAGGKAKDGGIESLTPYFDRIAHAFLIGDAQAAFAQTLEGRVSYTRCGTLDKAVEAAAAMASASPLLTSPRKQGEEYLKAVVLLSPACASFDQFKSFEHRGDVFCEWVEEMRDAV